MADYPGSNDTATSLQGLTKKVYGFNKLKKKLQRN
jgi:hypothetical protein